MPWTAESTASKDEDDFWVEEEYVPTPPKSAYDSRHCNDHDRRSRRSQSQTCRQGGRQLSGCMHNWMQGPDKGADTELMVVPAKEIGRIIGKGGSKIRELQDTTGARIKVLRDEEEVYTTHEAKIELEGTVEVRRKAQQLIEELIYPQGTGTRFSKREEGPNKEEPLPFIDWAKLIAESDQQREERWASLPPIVKKFYIEDPEVACMSVKDVETFRLANNNIVINYLGPKEQPPDDIASNPVTTFEQAFSNYPEILNEIYKNQFLKPSPIQSQAWPILLQGQDLIGIAQTGTGKTLAFLLPAMIHIDSQPVPREERTGPSCLVLAPTRELAQQIEREARKYNYRGIRCVCIYGGGSRREQIQTVNLGVEIVIATPGRLNDLVMNNIIDLKYVTFLVSFLFLHFLHCTNLKRLGLGVLVQHE